MKRRARGARPERDRVVRPAELQHGDPSPADLNVPIVSATDTRLCPGCKRPLDRAVLDRGVCPGCQEEGGE